MTGWLGLACPRTATNSSAPYRLWEGVFFSHPPLFLRSQARFRPLNATPPDRMVLPHAIED